MGLWVFLKVDFCTIFTYFCSQIKKFPAHLIDFEPSSCNLGNPSIFFSRYYFIYILSRLFILCGCGVAGKVCGGIEAQVVIGKYRHALGER
jgi:hypothetical protein